MTSGIEQWIFETHTQDTVWRWVKGLHYFSFKRAYGGHANDGDKMMARIRYKDREDMLNKLEALGIYIETLPIDEPFPEIGRTYSWEEFMKYKVRIWAYPELEAPCFQLLCGKEVFIWVDKTTIEFSIAGTQDGNIYNVSEDDILLCKEIESLFDSLGWQDLKQDSTYTTEHQIDKKVMEERYGYWK